jgi:hypothetical protein
MSDLSELRSSEEAALRVSSQKITHQEDRKSMSWKRKPHTRELQQASEGQQATKLIVSPVFACTDASF